MVSAYFAWSTGRIWPNWQFDLFFETISLLGFLDITRSWFSYNWQFVLSLLYWCLIVSLNSKYWCIPGLSPWSILYLCCLGDFIHSWFSISSLGPFPDLSFAYLVSSTGCWIGTSYITRPKLNSQSSSPNLLPPTVFHISLNDNCVCPVAQAKD